MEDISCIQSSTGATQICGRYLCKLGSSTGQENLFDSPTGRWHYCGERFSRDGKQMFAIGTKRRGELVRYDMKSHQFVPFLSGISAISPSFSKDGQWVAYISYPDHTLWRSRSDGTERRQLTYPPMEVAWPSISPDGTKVAFTICCYETYVIDMDGGPPQRIEKQSSGATFSPDQDLLIMTSLVEGKHNGDKDPLQLKILDVRTGKISVVPSSEGKRRWPVDHPGHDSSG